MSNQGPNWLGVFQCNLEIPSKLQWFSQIVIDVIDKNFVLCFEGFDNLYKGANQYNNPPQNLQPAT